LPDIYNDKIWHFYWWW